MKKFLTPYLLTPEAYNTYGFDKPCAVYIMDERKEGRYRVVALNKSHTKIVRECWPDEEDEFWGTYSPETLKEVQEMFDEFYGEDE